jgi:hypothetical protein
VHHEIRDDRRTHNQLQASLIEHEWILTGIELSSYLISIVCLFIRLLFIINSGVNFNVNYSSYFVATLPYLVKWRKIQAIVIKCIGSLGDVRPK